MSVSKPFLPYGPGGARPPNLSSYCGESIALFLIALEYLFSRIALSLPFFDAVVGSLGHSAY